MDESRRDADATYSMLLVDVLEHMLEKTGQPDQAAYAMAEQVREITGASLVVTLRHDEHCEHLGYIVCPEWRKSLIERSEAVEFVKAIAHIGSVTLWDAESQDPAVKRMFSACRLTNCLSVPLFASKLRVGTMAIIDISFTGNMDSLVHTMDRLSGVLGLILRNAGFQQEAEAIVRIKTRELRESETHLARSQEIAHVGSWFWDFQTDRIFWSEEALRIPGVRPEEVEHTLSGFLSLVHPADRGIVKKTIRAAATGEKPLHIDYRVIKKDGEIRFIHTEGEVTIDDRGNRAGIFGIGQDVTELKRAEDALRKSNTILARAQSIAHVGNWGWNLITNDLQWSDEVFRIFAHQPMDFPPTISWLIASTHINDREIVKRSLEEALQESKLFDIDFRITVSNGSIRYIHMVADKFKKDPSGHPMWLYGIIQDITRRKNVEIQLIDAKTRAELYVDIMAHDINNVNQSALMNIELLQLENNLTEDEHSIISNIQTTIEGVVKITENVRKIQLISSGDIHPENVDLDAMISRCVEEAYHPKDKKVEINFTPKRGRTIHGASLLKEIFCNLINNSIKYSGPRVRIDIAIDDIQKEGKNFFKITVTDNGYGIPDDVKQKLFRRFQRGTTKAHGKGLGLYIVKMLVEQFDGEVWVEDRVPGDYTKGSKFVVILPTNPNQDQGAIGQAQA